MKAIKIIFIFFLPFALLLSCSSASEKNGLNDVASTWGPTTITKGFSTSTSEGNGKYVELEVSNPEFFGKDVKMEPIARGVAFLFFKNLTAEEQKAYAKYSIVLKNDSGHSETFSYPAKAVLGYFEKEKIANAYYAKLLQGDFNYIYNNFENPGIPIDTLVNAFTPLLNEVTSYDRIATNKIYFAKYNLEEDKQTEAVEFAGNIIKADSVVKYFSITLSLDKSKKDIFGIRYWNK